MSHSKLATCRSAFADSAHRVSWTGRQKNDSRHNATCLLTGASRREGRAAEVVLAHAFLQRLQHLAALNSTCRKDHRLLSRLTQCMQGLALN